ncbi:hypothetical protein B0J13DRAFT_663883 [Dactylonectria estremocensis]|uniref:BZIP domain-containing protein n=1 Tax=Dactylonectria estremocensis TaxID=1079267 RepID=A0A9P9I652_9HYPO|nr:hypothetical protein B0J13DRAFT_663883 [Dactylonectria estremocensis]
MSQLASSGVLLKCGYSVLVMAESSLIVSYHPTLPSSLPYRLGNSYLELWIETAMDSANSTLRNHVPRIEVDKSTNGLHPGTEAVIIPEKGVMEMPKPGSHFHSYTSFPKARQRSKTEVDRDRRRIDRLARNRQSARNSTLRKRLALETKEERIKELEVALETSLKANHVLVEELNLWRQMANFMTPPPIYAWIPLRGATVLFPETWPTSSIRIHSTLPPQSRL